MKYWLKRHRLALLLAFCVSILYGSQHIILQKRLTAEGKSYLPTISQLDELHFTFPKAKHVFLTGHIEGDISVAENVNSPTFLPPIPHLSLGYLARLLGNMDTAVIASNFLLPPIIFLLLYFLAFEITGALGISTLFGMTVIIIPRYLVFFPLFTKYYQAWFITQLFITQRRLPLDRFEDPKFTLPFFILALYLIIRALKRKEKWVPWMAGVAYGLLFYTYFYFYVYLSIGLAIMLGIFAIQKKWIDVKNITIIIGTGIITSSYYWVSFWQLTHLTTYLDIISRIGPEKGYSVFLYPQTLFAYAQSLGLTCVAFFLFKKERAIAVFFSGLFLATFFVYNIQVITGFNPQPDHWIKPRQLIVTLAILVFTFKSLKDYSSRISEKWCYVAISTVISVLIYKTFVTEDSFLRHATQTLATAMIIGMCVWWLLYKKLKISKQNIGNVLIAILIALLFFKGYVIERKTIESSMLSATLPNAEVASLRWLNENTPQFSVVGTISFLSNAHIINLTHNKLFVPNALNTTISNKEIFERFSILNKLLGISSETFSRYFATKETYPPADYDHQGISFIYVDEYRAKEKGSIFTNKGFLPPVWSTNEHARKIDEYEKINSIDVHSIPYALDYIYWGPREKKWAEDPILSIPNLEIVYNVDGIKIYALPK